MKKVKIKLKYIDLSKTIIKMDTTTHPNIKVETTRYLCKIYNNFYAGTFTMQWYGLCFNGFGDGFIQFDPPGVNRSGWKGVWEIIEK